MYITQDTPELQLVNQLGKEKPLAHTKHDLHGGGTKYPVEQGTASTGKVNSLNPEDKEVIDSKFPSSQGLTEHPGLHVCHSTNDSMGAMAHGNATNLSSQSVEWSTNA